RVSLAGQTLILEWDPALRVPRAYGGDATAAREERPLVALFWFAALRHFPGVRTLAQVSPSS
ncbi:MAG: hypothetical protein ABI968_02020, partial [Acidobacteriota bacterium]